MRQNAERKGVADSHDSAHLIWLSHVLNLETPAYGGDGRLSVSDDKSIGKGDSCNTSRLRLDNHIGSHVDAPLHFINGGASVDTYSPEEWVFTEPLLLDVKGEAGQLLAVGDFSALIPPDDNVDLLFIRTGFEKRRNQNEYWQNNPGLLPELATFFRSSFPSLRALGLDTVSISGYRHREVGREAHLAFLSGNIRIFEDLALAEIQGSKSLKQVVALPLRIAGLDGAPCSIIGWESIS